MQWELLTAPEFQRAVRDTEVCVIGMGVLEKHSEHLPLGTDYINAHEIVRLACEKEPAVAFPPFYFGQIYEARCFPGALTICPTLLVELIQSVFDEIGRNGFRKIVIFNGHGGNTHLLHFMAQCALWEEKPYSIYLHSRGALSEERLARWRETVDESRAGHAGEMETSLSLSHMPDAVRMDQVPPAPANPLGRMDHLSGAFSGIGWYANYPEHYAGDARFALAAEGQVLVEIAVESLAEFIAAVKADEVAPSLTAEFFARERGLRS